MKRVRTVLSSFGGIMLAALLITAFAPKAARGVAAALVQIANTRSAPVPVDTVRHSASNFITLTTNGSSNSPATTWTQLYPDNSVSVLPFVLPPGEQLVVTDITVNAACVVSPCPPAGTQVSVVMPDNQGFGQTGPFFYSTSVNYQQSEGSNLFAVHTDHLTSGIVFTTLPAAYFNVSFGNNPGEIFSVTIQAYLAP
jgi:hypothetical protein